MNNRTPLRPFRLRVDEYSPGDFVTIRGRRGGGILRQWLAEKNAWVVKAPDGELVEIPESDITSATGA